LTNNPIKANEVRGLYATSDEVLDDVAEIDGLAIAIRVYRDRALLISLEETGSPSINAVKLGAVRDSPVAHS
jgi:hypothetical protein